MIISTFNIKNDYNFYNKNKSLEIFKYLRNYKIDILGLQEVSYNFDRDFNELIKNEYSMVGKYRFRFKLFHPTDNEKTPIITKQNIVFNETYELPYYPSKLKRVMTQIVVDINGKEVSIYNTHLESKIESVKEKQLDKIYDILNDDTRPKVLIGDFNLKCEDIIFERFIKRLNELGMKRVEINERTFKQEREDKAIDHVFLSNNIKLTNSFVMKDLIVSDHYPIIIDVNFDNI